MNGHGSDAYWVDRAMEAESNGYIGIDESMEMIRPVHPGEMLLEDYLVPMGISQCRLAREIHVSPGRINKIVHGKRPITADTALRLSEFFGTSAEFWVGLQADYDLLMARYNAIGTSSRPVIRRFSPSMVNRRLAGSHG